MKLIILAAALAVCGAAKLDRSYLPPASARSAGGIDGDLSAPNIRSSENTLNLPKGGYINEHQAVVVDAVAAGVRAAGPGDTGLGAPRPTYGFTSKVGDDAFRAASRIRQPYNLSDLPEPNLDAYYNDGSPNIAQHHDIAQIGQVNGPNYVDSQEEPNIRPQAALDKQANIVSFNSEVGPESFNYAFETDNGIIAEENGVAANGVQAQGGFSFKGDDGQTYSVSYVADENGYQPKGAHLPTPPPIPPEIRKAIEKNAQDAAAGIVDDGSYDAKKYNTGDYAGNNDGRYNNEQSIKRFGSSGTQNVQQHIKIQSQSSVNLHPTDDGIERLGQQSSQQPNTYQSGSGAFSKRPQKPIPQTYANPQQRRPINYQSFNQRVSQQQPNPQDISSEQGFRQPINHQSATFNQVPQSQPTINYQQLSIAQKPQQVYSQSGSASTNQGSRQQQISNNYQEASVYSNQRLGQQQFISQSASTAPNQGANQPQLSNDDQEQAYASQNVRHESNPAPAKQGPNNPSSQKPISVSNQSTIQSQIQQTTSNNYYQQASTSINQGSSQSQGYLPPRRNPQNSLSRQPSVQSTAQPNLPESNEQAQEPARIQQLPLTDNEQKNQEDIVNNNQGSANLAERYQPQQPINNSQNNAHSQVSSSQPTFTASSQVSVGYRGSSQQPQPIEYHTSKPQNPQPSALPTDKIDSDASYDIYEEKEGDNKDEDQKEQEGPTQEVPDYIKYGSSAPTSNGQYHATSSYQYSHQSSQNVNFPSSAPGPNIPNQDFAPQLNQQVTNQQSQPQYYQQQFQSSVSPVGPTVSSPSSRSPSQSTKYPKPPTLPPVSPTVSINAESETTITSQATEGPTSAPKFNYQPPSLPPHHEQTEAVNNPLKQLQSVSPTQNQRPQQNHFGQKINQPQQPYQQPQQQIISTQQSYQQQNAYSQQPINQQSQNHQYNQNLQNIPKINNLQRQQQNFYQQEVQPQPYNYPSPSQQSSQQPLNSYRQPEPQQQPQNYNQHNQYNLPQPNIQQSQPQPKNSYQQPLTQQQDQLPQEPQSINYNQQIQYNQEQEIQIPQQQYQQPENNYQQYQQPNQPQIGQDQHLPNQPNPSDLFSQIAPQQYNQEIYQYNKPPEVLSVHNDANAEGSAPKSSLLDAEKGHSTQLEVTTPLNSGDKANEAPEQNQFASAFAEIVNQPFDQGFKSPVGGSGEVFALQRQKPSFDDATGYHY